MAGLASAGGAHAQREPGPIAVHGNITTFEFVPVLLAVAENACLAPASRWPG